MENSEKIIHALQEKIKQDKLDQRRTVLSPIDRAFVDTVAVLAEEANVELEISVKQTVSDKPEETVDAVEIPREFPELDPDVPKREALVEQGVTTDEKVKAMSKNELVALDDIGEVSAKKIIEFYNADEETEDESDES